MTREQLSRDGRLTVVEYKVRKEEILRLAATSLYSSVQIAEKYRRSGRLINKIRAENIEPVNPWMSLGECAEYLRVSGSVIGALIDKHYVEAQAFDPEDSPGVTLHGVPIHLAVRKAWLFKNKDRWGSASDAAAIAGISRKGMETRARQNRAAHIEAPGGKSFTVDGQGGLHYIYDLKQISPAISEPEEEQLEMSLERASMLRVEYRSDLTAEDAREDIRCDKELDITLWSTKGKQSEVTIFHIVWDEEESRPKIDILTRAPVTVRRPERLGYDK